MHGDWGPPGLLAEWLDERGIPYDLHRTYVGEPMPDPAGYAFVASLGSNRNPRDTGDPAVAAELVLLGRAIEEDVPVLGLCFGGQALAAALGGAVETAPAPELGWTEIETDEPELVPPGPWLEWHYERFSVPPGATEIARTAAATRRSATAATSACSSTPRAPSRSSRAGPSRTLSASPRSATATAAS